MLTFMKLSPPLDLAPSLYHQKLMATIRPRLAYEGGDVRGWQKKLRAKLASLTGFDQMPQTGARPALKARTLWTRDFSWIKKLGRVEKIALRAQEGSDITAYVCTPHKPAIPGMRMICLQGHSTGMHNSIAVDRDTETQHIKVVGDRDFAIGCLKRGISAICVEQRCFGERDENLPKFQGGSRMGCTHPTMTSLMLGISMIAERVYDVDRVIDYLHTRSDVDPQKIGVMGNSGGGTIATYAGALLDRVRFIMPSCSFATYRASILSIHHCPDNFVPGLYRWAEHGDVMALLAPRPVVIVAGKTDEIFPLPAVREAYAHTQRIYQQLGASERCRLVEGHQGHRFYAARAWPVLLDVLKRSATA